MRDWLRLANLDNIPLDIDRHPGGGAPAWEIISTHLAANGHRVLTLADEQDGRLVGLGQTKPRDAVWSVARLMVHADLPASDSVAVLVSLLGGLSAAAAARGALRLHAHVERQAAANEAFSRAGFTPFGHESVYWLPTPAEPPRASGDSLLRAQENKDAWGIHQLYCAVTPRVVQQAEGKDAAYWEIPPAAAMRALNQVGERHSVLEIGGEIVGYVRTRRLAHRLDIIVHPKAYTHARQLIRQGVVNMYPTRAIRCSLPEYQGELGIALEEEGFRFLGTQVAFIKHLAAPQRAESRVKRPLLEPSLGPARTISGS